MAKVGNKDVSLGAPGILSFVFSVVLTVMTLVAYFFDANIPFLETLNNQFWALIIAQIILIAGCLFDLGG